jgi:hypothetical protein
MSLEAWNEFRRGEDRTRRHASSSRYEPTCPVCYWCGAECSGDTTTPVYIDGLIGDLPVCDDESDCECD